METHLQRIHNKGACLLDRERRVSRVERRLRLANSHVHVLVTLVLQLHLARLPLTGLRRRKLDAIDLCDQTVFSATISQSLIYIFSLKQMNVEGGR